MVSLLTNSHIPLIALVVLISITPTFGQGTTELHPEELSGVSDEAWVAEVPCVGSPDIAQGFINGREFRICVTSSKTLLQPTVTGQPNDSDLFIGVYSSNRLNPVERIELVRGAIDEHPGLVLADPMLFRRAKGKFSSLSEFKVPLQVLSQARSGMYPIFLTVGENPSRAGGQKEFIKFALPIFSPRNSPVTVEKKPNSSVDCWAGSNCSALQLTVTNNLPYKLKIVNVSVASEDLLDDKPVSTDHLREIEANASPIDMNLITKSKPISFRRVFVGFGRPQVSVRIDYKDEYNRSLSTQTSTDLQIRPNLLIITIFLILGAAIGTLVRLDLGRLQRAGIISKRERAVFAATTFASGIVICLIALFANVKLIVSDQNSYSPWDPKVLFLTALIATVTGLPILYAYLKLPKPVEAASLSAPRSDDDDSKKAAPADQEGEAP